MVDGKHDYRPKAPDYIRVIDGSSFGASLQPRKRKSSSNWLALDVLDTSAMMNAARRRNPCFPTRDKMTERSTSDMIGHYTPRKMIAGGSNFTPVSQPVDKSFDLHSNMPKSHDELKIKLRLPGAPMIVILGDSHYLGVIRTRGRYFRWWGWEGKTALVTSFHSLQSRCGTIVMSRWFSRTYLIEEWGHLAFKIKEFSEVVEALDLFEFRSPN